MGFGVEFLATEATPLPIIVGPVALRPTLSRGLPFLPVLSSSFLIGTEPENLYNYSPANEKGHFKVSSQKVGIISQWTASRQGISFFRSG